MHDRFKPKKSAVQYRGRTYRTSQVRLSPTSADELHEARRFYLGMFWGGALALFLIWLPVTIALVCMGRM